MVKKIFGFFCFFLVIIFCIAVDIIFANNDDTVTLYYTGNMFGDIGGERENGNIKKIGLDLVKAVKQNTENCILIDLGNSISGNTFAKQKKGHNVIEIMNAVGYDGMILGPHEFDYGNDALLDCIKVSNFPFLLANSDKINDSLDIPSENVFLNSFILDLSDKKIGFLKINPISKINNQNSEFYDDIKKTVQDLKNKKANIIIAVNNSDDTSLDSIVIKKIYGTGIDILIDCNILSDNIKNENGLVVLGCGAKLDRIGKITLNFNNEKPDIKANFLTANQLSQFVSPDVEITKMYDNIYCEVSSVAEKVVGKIKNNIYGAFYNGVNLCKLSETNSGNLICDAMIYHGNEILDEENLKNLHPISVISGGSIKSSIKKGFIKFDDIYSLYPSEGKLIAKVISPKILYQMLEYGAKNLGIRSSQNEYFDCKFSAFPQIAGIRIKINPSLEAYNLEKNISGKKITDVKLTDSSGNILSDVFRDDETLSIILFMSEDDVLSFPMLSSIETKKTGECIYNILSDYIRYLTYKGSGEFSYPYCDNRILIDRSSYKNESYNSEIRVKNSVGNLISASVKVKIDGNEQNYFVTDENGKIFINNLENVPHIVEISYMDNSCELYLNNMLGIKNAISEFIDNFDSDIENVSNIISQIPYNVLVENEQIIKFARSSYDSLNESQKLKILNYKKLQNAEDELNNIKHSSSADTIQFFKNNKFQIFVCLILTLLLLGFMFLFKSSKKY